MIVSEKSLGKLFGLGFLNAMLIATVAMPGWSVAQETDVDVAPRVVKSAEKKGEAVEEDVRFIRRTQSVTGPAHVDATEVRFVQARQDEADADDDAGVVDPGGEHISGGGGGSNTTASGGGTVRETTQRSVVPGRSPEELNEVIKNMELRKAHGLQETTLNRLKALYFTALADGRSDDALSLQAALAALGAPVDERKVNVRGTTAAEPTKSREMLNEAMVMRLYDSVQVRRRVTGSADGDVRGTDDYTADSSIEAAAVHAGLVKVGETANIVIQYSGRRDSFSGSERNGITSKSCDAYPRSFRLKALSEAPDAPYMGTRAALRGNESAYMSLKMLSGQAPLEAGTVILVPVKGDPDGPVYGDGSYSSESSLDAAAVHSGILKRSQNGLAKLTIVPGQDSYIGTTKNGVISKDCGKRGLSFRLEAMSVFE